MPRLMSRVHTLAPRPYGVLLASCKACSAETHWADRGKGMEDFQRVAIDPWRRAIKSWLEVITFATINFRRTTSQDRLATTQSPPLAEPRKIRERCVAINHRTQLRPRVSLIANLQFVEETLLSIDEVVSDLLVDKHAMDRAARLTVMLIRVLTNQSRHHLRSASPNTIAAPLPPISRFIRVPCTSHVRMID